MAVETKAEKARIPRGRVQFDAGDDGKTLAVHLDRKGFRRLLATLERLAETGASQTLESSGRRLAGKNKDLDRDRSVMGKLVFHIDGEV